MSRIGKMPIPVPDKVKVAVSDGLVKVEGPKGKLERAFSGVAVKVEGGKVIVERPDDSRGARSKHGLYRALVANMVEGVSKGFEKTLEIYGVGYKADVKGDTVNFNLGYSHPIAFKLPSGIKASWNDKRTGDKQGAVTIVGIDRDLLGRTAAEIRSLRPPEPYKGKGIRYAGEYVRRKQGKTGAA